MNNQPKIILFLISNRKRIEYEYLLFKGNHINLTKNTILPNIKKEGKIILVYHQYEYLCNKVNDLVFICLVERKYNKSLAFNFLDESMNIYSSNNEINNKKILYDSLLEKYNSQNIDKSKMVMDKLMDLKDVVTENLEKILDSNNKLDELKHKISEITDDSNKIYIKTKKVKRKVLIKYYLTRVFFVLFIIVWLYIILNSFFDCWDFSCFKK